MTVSQPDQTQNEQTEMTAEQKRNRAARILSLLFMVGAILSGIFTFIQYLSTKQDLYQLVVVLIFAVCGAAGFALSRAGKTVRSALVIIVPNLVLVPLFITQAQGLGLLLSIFSSFFPLGIASLTLPPKYFRSVLIAAIIAGLFSVFGDLYWPIEREVTAAYATNFGTIIAIASLVAIFFLIIRNFANYSLRTKIITVTVLMVSLAVIIVATAIGRLSRTAIIERTGENLQTLAQAEALAVGELLFRETATLRTLAFNDQLRQSVQEQNESYRGDDSEISAEIERLDQQWINSVDESTLITAVLQNGATNELSQYQQVWVNNAEVFITDRYGALVASTNRTSDYYQADEAWWQAAYNNGTGDFYFGEPEFDESSGVNAINIALPLRNGTQEIIGILRTTLNLSLLEDVVVAARFGQTGQISIHLPGQFDIELDDDQFVVETENLVAPEILSQALPEEESYIFTPIDETVNILATSPVTTLSHEPVVDRLNWVVAVHQAEAEALASAAEQQRVIAVLSAILLLVTAGVGYFISARLAAPILDLTHVARQVAAGDLTARAAVGASDEVGVLAETLNTMTSQLSESIANLEAQVQARTRALEASNEVGRRISANLIPQRLVAEVVNQVKIAFDYYHVHVYLIDKAGENLVMAGGTGEAGKQLLANKHQIEHGQGLVGQAAETNASVLVPDVTKNSTWLPNPLLPDTKAETAVPIIYADKLFGVLDVQHNVVDGLSQRDVDLLESIAAQVAIALQNARAYERAQDKAEQEAHFNEINRTIQSTTDVETAMQVAVRELGRVLDAKQVRVQLQSGQNGRNHEEKI